MKKALTPTIQIHCLLFIGYLIFLQFFTYPVFSRNNNPLYTKDGNRQNSFSSVRTTSRILGGFGNKTGINATKNNAILAQTIPNAPDGLNVTPSEDDLVVEIQWDSESTNHDGFIIERKTSTSEYIQVATVAKNTSEYYDSESDLQPNTCYFYRVRAYNSAGSSVSEPYEGCTYPLTPPYSYYNLAVTVVSYSQLDLTWTDYTHNEDGFYIERKSGSGNFIRMATVGKNVTSYQDLNLNSSTCYTYRIQSFNTAGNSAYSAEKSACTLSSIPAAPGTPSLTIVSDIQINLTWADNSWNEDGFIIEAQYGSNGFAQVATVGANVTTYQHVGLNPSTCYTYRIKAYKASESSNYSANSTACTKPLATVPIAPDGLSISAVSESQMEIQWDIESTNEDGFRIERKCGSGTFTQIADVGPGVNDFYDNGLKPATWYTYRITAYNRAGSATSAEASWHTYPKPALPVSTFGNSLQSFSFDGLGNVIGQSISYYDLLGRSTQTQSYMFSQGKAMVSQTIYDAFGRPAISTLAAPVSKADMNYVTDFVLNPSGTEFNYLNFDGKGANPDAISGKLANYYSDNNTLEPYTPSSAYPYTQVEFSKLDPGVARKSALAGNEHRLGSGHESQSYTMAVPESELKFFEDNFSGLSDVMLETKGVTKTVGIDADGNTGIVYTSADGHSISACYADATADPQTVLYNMTAENGYYDIHLNVAGDVTISQGTCKVYNLTDDSEVGEYSGSVNLNPGVYRFQYEGVPANNTTLSYIIYYKGHSFNFYDNAGRSVFSLSPKGYVAWKSEPAQTFENFKKYATYNEYNSLGWVLSSSSPDEGTTRYRYATDGRIRYSQNAQQYKENKFSYTNYDDANRPIESGECSAAFEDAILETNVSENISQRVKTIYDFPTDDKSYNGSYQNYTLGKISKTYNENSANWYSYTYDGKVEWIVQEINGLPQKTIEYVYDDDILGRVSYVKYQSGQSDEFIHHYTYDDDGRLEYVYTQANNETAENMQAHYLYYTHGPLKRVELAENLQGIDYVYNINGWLKSINHPDLTTAKDPGGDGSGGAHANFGNDLFGMSLDYYSGDYARSGTSITSVPGTQKYNGNIAASRWNNKKYMAGTNQQWEYQYNYGNRGFLTQASFGSVAAGNFTPTGAYNETITGYDDNGNITGLTRYASQRIDALTYNYPTGPTNQLRSVTDSEHQTTITADIKDQPEKNYLYNAIGQQYWNESEKQYFTYDVYGHVTGIFADSAKTTPKATYIYDDKGFRIKSITTTATTWYVRDASGHMLATYEGTTPLLSEVNLYGSSRIGVAQANTATGNIEKYAYELTDHLGNVRVTLIRSVDGIKNNETLSSSLATNKIITSSGSITLLPGFSTNGHTFSASIDANVVTDNICTMLSATDYYPFGMEMPNRKYQGSDAYRFGYQGQYAEKDENGYNHFEARDYDSRIGRWLSQDPAGEFWSPYVGMGNMPTIANDPDGKDIIIYGNASWIPGKPVYKPLLVILTHELNYEVYTNLTSPFPKNLATGLSEKKWDPIVIDATSVDGLWKGKNNMDAFMINIGADAAMGGGLGGSIQIVSINKGKDVGSYAYYSDLTDFNFGYGNGYSVTAGPVKYYDTKSDLNRSTFSGRGISISGGYRIGSFNDVRSYVDGKWHIPGVFTPDLSYHAFLVGLGGGPSTWSLIFGFTRSALWGEAKVFKHLSVRFL